MTEKEHIEKAESFYGKNEIEANIYLHRAAKQGSAKAFFELAHRYARGIPVLDLRKAEECLEQAALLGSIKASYAQLRCSQMITAPDENPDDLLTAIEKSLDMEAFDLKSHFEVAMENMFGHAGYGPYELQILKTLAAFGEPLAAEFLAMEYSTGGFHEELESQPLEELRWSLIEQFLRGNHDWPEYANRRPSLKKRARDSIVEEVRSWIKDHPVAKRVTTSAQYKKRLIENGGNINAMKSYYQPKRAPRGDPDLNRFCTIFTTAFNLFHFPSRSGRNKNRGRLILRLMHRCFSRLDRYGNPGIKGPHF